MNVKGTITAMITPFLNHKIDEEGFKENIHLQLSAGIDGILPLGSTGEASTLTSEEKAIIIKIAVNEAKGKVPIWVGTGAYCTRQTIENTLIAESLGADIAMIVAPYYNKPTQEGIFKHFEAIAAKVDIPIVAYNVPGRCGVNIETSTMLRLASIPNIIGVKEASGNIYQSGDILHAVEKQYPRFHVFSGDDVAALPMIALGAVGLISVVSNLIPADIVALVNASLHGKMEIARQMHQRLLPLFKAVFLESNPIPIKAAMDICGLAAGDCRLPLCKMMPENYRLLYQVLTEMNLIDTLSQSKKKLSLALDKSY